MHTKISKQRRTRTWLTPNGTYFKVADQCWPPFSMIPKTLARYELRQWKDPAFFFKCAVVPSIAWCQPRST